MKRATRGPIPASTAKPDKYNSRRFHPKTGNFLREYGDWNYGSPIPEKQSVELRRETDRQYAVVAEDGEVLGCGVANKKFIALSRPIGQDETFYIHPIS